MTLAATIEPADELARRAVEGLLLADVATAQELLGRVGRLSRIDLIVPDGAAGETLLARARAALPPGATIVRTAARSASIETMTGAFRLNLMALSLLALVCGAFLIYNTMTFSVVQRRPQIGRLRALGVTRREVLAGVLGEAAGVGLAGTAIGLLLGVALGRGLVVLVTQTINDLYFVLTVREAIVSPWPLVKGAALGLAGTLLAALPPALEATGAPPVSVLSRSAVETGVRRALPRLVGGGLALLALAALLLALPTRSLPVSFAGLFAVILGCALLTPAAVLGCARLVARPAARAFGILGGMAARGVAAGLSRTGVAMAALMIAISVAVGVGVMIASFRETVIRWLDHTLAADVYVSAPSSVESRSERPLDPALVAALSAAPGVAAAHALRAVELETEGGPLNVLAVDMTPRGHGAFSFKEGRPEAIWPAFADGGAVIVSEPFAFRRGVGAGGSVTLPTDRGPQAFPVAGVFFDYGSDRGRRDDEPEDLGPCLRRPRRQRAGAVRRGRRRSRRAGPRAARARSGRTGGGHPVAARDQADLARDLRPHLPDHRGAASPGLRGGLRGGAVGADGAAAGAGAGAGSAARQRADARTALPARRGGDRDPRRRRRTARAAGRPGAGRADDLRDQPALVRLVAVDDGRPVAAGAGLRRGGAGRAAGRSLPGAAHGADLAGARAAGGVMRARGILLAAALLAVLLVLGGLAWRATARERFPLDAGLSLREAMGARADDALYARAGAPRAFSFPADHGPHPGFRTEWWYFTGNLQAADGRAFGYQLTFFRQAVAPEEPGAAPRASAWATRQVYLAHFAISDIEGRRFHAFERFARGAAGLAGAELVPERGLRVFLEDWSAEGTGAATFPLRLRAADGSVAIDLTLERGKPPVLQGDAGLSPKGPEPGNASYYYSLTRMPTAGTITVDGRALAVTGASWMDREWSTSALPDGVVGWDWFALQLDDGGELMVYQLRRADGTADPFSKGSLVAPDGSATPLGAADLALTAEGRRRAPSGAEYPARWRLAIPSQGLALEVTPALPDQELPVSIRYWEGAVRVSGTRDGAAVGGVGYLEMTGYAVR